MQIKVTQAIQRNMIKLNYLRTFQNPSFQNPFWYTSNVFKKHYSKKAITIINLTVWLCSFLVSNLLLDCNVCAWWYNSTLPGRLEVIVGPSGAPVTKSSAPFCSQVTQNTPHQQVIYGENIPIASFVQNASFLYCIWLITCNIRRPFPEEFSVLFDVPILDVVL